MNTKVLNSQLAILHVLDRHLFVPSESDDHDSNKQHNKPVKNDHHQGSLLSSHFDAAHVDSVDLTNGNTICFWWSIELLVHVSLRDLNLAFLREHIFIINEH